MIFFGLSGRPENMACMNAFLGCAVSSKNLDNLWGFLSQLSWALSGSSAKHLESPETCLGVLFAVLGHQFFSG